MPRHGTKPDCGPQSELLPLTWNGFVGCPRSIQRRDQGPVDRNMMISFRRRATASVAAMSASVIPFSG